MAANKQYTIVWPIEQYTAVIYLQSCMYTNERERSLSSACVCMFHNSQRTVTDSHLERERGE